MSIKKIDKNELRGYEGKEGLILQGCGGTTTVPSLKITD